MTHGHMGQASAAWGMGRDMRSLAPAAHHRLSPATRCIGLAHQLCESLALVLAQAAAVGVFVAEPKEVGRLDDLRRGGGVGHAPH